MKLPIRILLCAILTHLITLPSAQAAENPNGNWKWSFTTQNGDTIESVLILKQDADKVTGSVSNRFGKADIFESSLKDDQITFKVKREFNGVEILSKYTGKIQGNKITGKSELQRDGQTRERDWEAKREAAKTAAAGTWNTALILPDGNKIEGVLKLKADAEKLTGAIIRNDNETQIQEGKISGDEISFKVLREREGRTVTSKYKGKITGDTVKGKIESDWSGDWQTFDWEGARAK